MTTSEAIDQIREFAERGVVVLRQTLQNDELNGLTECFDQAGQLTARLHYAQGLLQGEATYFSLGQLVRSCTYEAGLLHGEVLDYSLSGALIQRAHYLHGLMHGSIERYWTNGAIMERQSFENGRPNGPAETFDSEGSPLQQADQTASEKPGLLQRLFTGNA
ncbi:MAG: toxin-antitoxin system YwqK family antitoxin [Burkholderiaceae bacterium]